jgi:hypothetical protein
MRITTHIKYDAPIIPAIEKPAPLPIGRWQGAECHEPRRTERSHGGAWSAAEDATLTALWETSTSYQIARLLKSRSRCAILGRAHRLHLSTKKSPIKRRSE